MPPQILMTAGDVNVKEELSPKTADHGPREDDRKRKLEELQVNGNENGTHEEPLRKENGHVTDVNGNEGPESKKRKMNFENRNGTDTVRCVT